MKTLLPVLCLCAMLAACSTFPVATYPAPQAPAASRAAAGSGTVSKVTLAEPGPAAVSQIKCRQVGPVLAPANQSFADYLRAAFMTELQAAGQLSPGGRTELAVSVTKFDFSTVDNYWMFEISVRNQANREARFSHLHPIEGSWYGNLACERAAAAFSTAVRQFVNQTIATGDFRRLLE